MPVRTVLDDVNLRLLAALQVNARMSSADLSAHLGISQTTCLERWRNLEALGVIRRYRTDIDVDRIASNLRVFVEVTLARHRPADLRAFADHICALPEVIAVYRISGPYDYMLSIACQSTRHYHELTEKIIDRAPNIERFVGYVVLGRTKKFCGYPLENLTGKRLDPPMMTRQVKSPGTREPKLDDIQLRILQGLQTQGRIANVDLAEIAGVSASPCSERVRRLEAHGYIQQYVTEIDLDLCIPHVYLMAEAVLESHRPEDFTRFEQIVRDIPEIIAAYRLAGSYDYTMDILCRDMHHFHELEERMLQGELALSRLRFHVVLKRVKLFSGFPLRQLLEK